MDNYDYQALGQKALLHLPIWERKGVVCSKPSAV